MEFLILTAGIAVAFAVGWFVGHAKGIDHARPAPLDREPISTKRPVGPRRDLY